MIRDYDDSVFVSLTCNNVVGLIADNYRIRQLVKEEELRHTRFVSWVCGIGLVVALIIAVFLSRHFRLVAMHRLNEKILSIQNFKSALESKLSGLETKVSSLESSQKSAIVLMKTKYDILEQLCFVLNMSSGDTKSRERISAMVDRIIDKLTPGSSDYAALEDFINVTYDNIIAELRSDLPNLKDRDYSLFVFL